MDNSRSSLRNREWEQHGFATMAEVRDEQQARMICGLQLRALEDDLRPDAQKCQRDIAEKTARGKALEQALYGRYEPISDTLMLALSVTLKVLVVMFVIAVVASLVTNAATFVLFGWSILVATLIGVLVTGVAVAAGHVLFERLLSAYPSLQVVFGIVTFALFIWAVLNFAQARSEMVEVMQKVTVAESFVDGAADVPTVRDATEDNAPRTTVERLLGSGLTKMALAAELIVAILFGLIASIRGNPDFAGWRHLKRLKHEIANLHEAASRLIALGATAQKECAAGILRGRRFANASPIVPFFKMIPIVLLFVFGFAEPSAAQTLITRQEGMLIDISQSVGGNNGNTLFREFLVAVRHLLETEPPNSRITVMLIAADSFGGGVPTLLKGRTPGTQGVFDDELQRARKQLVNAFQAKTAELRPTAAATDIVGGMWRLKAAIESEADPGQSRDVYLFSDMIETASFRLSALLPLGTTLAIERVKAEGHVVPLRGFRIHIYGAAPVGLTPQMWTAVKSFWEAYFAAAGAQIVRYSTETSINR